VSSSHSSLVDVQKSANTSSHFSTTSSTPKASDHGNGASNNLTPSASNVTLSGKNSTTGTNQTGYLYASSCNSALISYSSAKWKFLESSSTTYVTNLQSTQYLSWSGTDCSTTVTTTLCGHPYGTANCEPYTTTETYYFTTPTTITTQASWTGTPPSCSINTSDCFLLESEYTSSLSSWSANTSLQYPKDVQCTTTPFDPCAGPCGITAGTARLLYWPVTTTNGDFCAQNGSTVTVSPTGDGPNTVVFEGTTLTSPTVYMSLQQVGAEVIRGATASCGPTYNNILVPMQPSELSSRTGYQNFGVASFNLANLNGPLPYDVFTAQWKCQPNPDSQCPVVAGDYNPLLEIPWQKLTHLDPYYSSCTYGGRYGADDPPQALQTAAGLTPDATTTASSTSHGSSSAAKQQPGSTANAPGPGATTSAKTAQTSTTSKSSGNAGDAIASALGLSQDPVASTTTGTATETATETPQEFAETSSTSPQSTIQSAVPIATVHGLTLSADPSTPGNVILSGKTITAGQSVVIDNTPVVVGTGNIIIGGTSTVVIPTPGTSSLGSGVIATLGSQGISTDPANPMNVVVNGITLRPGAATLIDGTPILVGTGTIYVPGSAIAVPQPKETPSITVAGMIVGADTSDPGAFVISGQRIAPGNPAVTINGVSVSLASDGELIVGTASTNLAGVTGPNGFVAAPVSTSEGTNTTGSPTSLGSSVHSTSILGVSTSSSFESVAAAFSLANGDRWLWTAYSGLVALIGSCAVLL
jgi:hypothetical protein